MAERDRRRSGKKPDRAKVGTGGHGRKALEGRGPTPKAEDRVYHAAHKRKAAAERLAAKRGDGVGRPPRTPQRRDKTVDELVTGRNAVVEALRANLPATALTIAIRAEMDDRMREALSIANHRGIPVMEVMRPELDRMAGPDGVHQGIALTAPAYEYANAFDLLDGVEKRSALPLFVALDGVTDPRNLGAIIRSVGAFGGHGVIVPSRRSVGVTATAWRTSAGALARVPVAQVANLTQMITAFKQRGVFVIGLDGGGEQPLPSLELADRPLLVVVGSEGNGLSRIVTAACDQIVSIPIAVDTESLNAGIAASVALYQIATLRSTLE